MFQIESRALADITGRMRERYGPNAAANYLASLDSSEAAEPEGET